MHPWSDSCAATNHTWVCSHGHGAVVMFKYKTVYANYWLEFSQHKLTGQLKIHYAEFSFTFIRHNIIAMHIN